MAIFVSDSPEKTKQFGEQYAQTRIAGDVVILNGEMGAGKTVFAKGVAAGLGIDDEILSPTYAYMNDYYGKLYHFDCYRLNCGEQAEALGLTDYFYADGVCLVEWAENISSVLPDKFKTLTKRKLSDDVREIEYE